LRSLSTFTNEDDDEEGNENEEIKFRISKVTLTTSTNKEERESEVIKLNEANIENNLFSLKLKFKISISFS
jgi:hypothetical protein